MEEQNTNGNGYFRGKIEQRVTDLEEKVDKMLYNHLPHIQDAIEQSRKDLNLKIDSVINSFNSSLEGRTKSLQTRLDTMTMWLIGVLGGLVTSLILLALNLLKQ